MEGKSRWLCLLWCRFWKYQRRLNAEESSGDFYSSKFRFHPWEGEQTIDRHLFFFFLHKVWFVVSPTAPPPTPTPPVSVLRRTQGCVFLFNSNLITWVRSVRRSSGQGAPGRPSRKPRKRRKKEVLRSSAHSATLSSVLMMLLFRLSLIRFCSDTLRTHRAGRNPNIVFENRNRGQMFT